MLLFSSAQNLLQDLVGLDDEEYEEDYDAYEDQLSEEESEFVAVKPAVSSKRGRKSPPEKLLPKMESKSFKVKYERHNVISVEEEVTSFSAIPPRIPPTHSKFRTESPQPRKELLKIDLMRRGCPGCRSINSPPPTYGKNLCFLDLFHQLQVRCDNCSCVFCFACLSHHPFPTPFDAVCGESKAYIAHRICKHLNELLLGREDKLSTSSFSSVHTYQPSKAQNNEIWGGGVGYGSGGYSASSGLLPHVLMESKTRQLDRHVCRLLTILSDCIGTTHTDGGKSNPLTHTSTASAVPTLMEVLTKTCLVDFLSYFLQNDSFLDIEKRLALYQKLVHITQQLCSHDELSALMTSDSRLLTQLTKLERKAAHLMKHTSGQLHSLLLHFAALQNQIASLQSVASAKTISDIPAAVTQCLPLPEVEAVSVPVPGPGPQEMDEEERYVKFMREHQFGEEEGMEHYHYYKQHAKTAASGSSILVRVDAEHCNLIRALITGPPGTPYAFGCWTFDIFIPSTYPSTPPLVWCTTTGHGAVRFNPNLYNNGKVCLSLLGTWHGSQEEQWNPMISTISQVLLSLQSMVFVPHPYFNEPGYQSTMNTAAGVRASQAYNINIVKYTLRHAVLDHILLSPPPPGFAEEVFFHFSFFAHQLRNLMKLNAICPLSFTAALRSWKSKQQPHSST